jgi:protein O-mannosyl-transferase
MKNEAGRRQKAEALHATQAAPLAAQSQIANRKSQIYSWLMAVLLVLGTVAIYWPAMRCGFVNYDDDFYVTSNVHVQNGLNWAGMKWAWANPVAGNWHPVTVLSHMLDCQLLGLNPGAHHLTNVLLHALNAGLVFWFLQRMTGAVWRSLLVAALFAVHPLRVESVAWVSERKDVLSGFFGLLALLAYACYAQRRMQNAECRMQDSATPNTQHVTRNTFHARNFYLLSLCFFALGLMSKPMLVTWPFVMLLLDYWPLERMPKAAASDTHHGPRTTPPVSLLLEKLPFFALAAAVSVVTFLVQQRAGAVMVAESLPLSARVGNALISYGRYLGKLFWPTDLAVYYPRPGQWPMGKVLLATGLILGLSVLVWVRRRRHPYSLTGWLWFLGTLVPVIGLVQAGGQAMADRYTYLPSLGVLILAVWGACEMTRSWRYQALAWSVAGGAAIVLCLALTHQQLGHWKDSEALFRHALEVTENNGLAHSNLGAALAKKGQIDEAIGQLQEALRLQPHFAPACNNLANALLLKGQIDEAIGQYQEALRLKPDHAEAHYGLGTALLLKGETAEAMRQFQEVLRLKPDHAEAHYNLGNVLGSKGETDEAIRQFHEAIRLKPDHPLAHYNLGNAFLLKGQMDEAIRQYRETLRLNPNHAEAHYNLATALGSKGQTDEAITQYQEATRLNPGNADAHYNLGLALASKGQTEEAIRRFEGALKVKPNYPEAHNHLGQALVRKGQTDEAIRQFQEALRLKPDYAAARQNLDAVLAASAASSTLPGASTNR